jgi:hypothetical protein
MKLEQGICKLRRQILWIVLGVLALSITIYVLANFWFAMWFEKFILWAMVGFLNVLGTLAHIGTK